MQVVERLRYFFGRCLVGIDDCKKFPLFLVDDGEESSQSKDSAFAPERHGAFDAAFQKRVVTEGPIWWSGWSGSRLSREPVKITQNRPGPDWVIIGPLRARALEVGEPAIALSRQSSTYHLGRLVSNGTATDASLVAAQKSTKGVVIMFDYSAVYSASWLHAEIASGIIPEVYGEVRLRNGSRILPPAD
jgi:hypothetical protein